MILELLAVAAPSPSPVPAPGGSLVGDWAGKIVPSAVGAFLGLVGGWFLRTAEYDRHDKPVIARFNGLLDRLGEHLQGDDGLRPLTPHDITGYLPLFDSVTGDEAGRAFTAKRFDTPAIAGAMVRLRAACERVVETYSDFQPVRSMMDHGHYYQTGDTIREEFMKRHRAAATDALKAIEDARVAAKPGAASR